VPLPLQPHADLYRIAGPGAGLPKPVGLAEAGWNPNHGAEESLYGGVPPPGSAGVGAADAILAHSRATLARAHEDVLRTRVASLPPAIPHSLPDLAKRASPANAARSSVLKDDAGSSNDLSGDDRDDYSNKKKRERWTQEVTAPQLHRSCRLLAYRK
jgi:hypothetical protein